MRNLLLRNLPGKPSVLGLSPAKLPTRKKKQKKKTSGQMGSVFEGKVNTSVRTHHDAFQKTCGTKLTLS